MENISVGTTANIRTRINLGTAYTETYATGTTILYKGQDCLKGRSFSIT